MSTDHTPETLIARLEARKILEQLQEHCLDNPPDPECQQCCDIVAHALSGATPARIRLRNAVTGTCYYMTLSDELHPPRQFISEGTYDVELHLNE